MTFAWLRLPLTLALACTTACGGDDSTPPADSGPGTPDAPAAAADADPTAPDAMPGTTMRLITAPYTIAAGDEFYQCTRITATEDMNVTLIAPTAGVGTHHTILAIDPSPSGPGTGTCQALATDWTVLFASGVGSPSLPMPPGVALPIRAGEEIVFNLHLFNAGETEINGESALDVQVVPTADVDQFAEVVLAGPVTFSIPTGADRHVTGGCTMGGSTNFFAVFPHMHQLGTHIKVTARQSGSDIVVYDQDYSFSDQQFASWTPLPLTNGDRINVDCTYNNTTGGSVSFGDSSTQEMCFAISYRYPPLPDDFIPGAICAF